jgi:N-acetylmuramic acid 6-phosphate etherase
MINTSSYRVQSREYRMNQNPAITLDQFLSASAQFRLGELVTEQPHPETTGLSDLAMHDLPAALRILKQIDCQALEIPMRKAAEIHHLAERIDQTFRGGHRVFLCGCGATGRLALTLETLWREKFPGAGQADLVSAFMAGGDAALVRSIEQFEDHPEYGAAQLDDAGFVDGDLLISCTEGGETPFVIGATEQAALISTNHPFFLYCNPDEVLCRTVGRSRRVIENAAIHKINLTVGPMAIAGSTRMQASTVLMASVGFALFLHGSPAVAIRLALDDLSACWSGVDTGFLAGFITAEADSYRNGGNLLYETDAACAMTILTDTTERSPTFSLTPFENSLDEESPVSLCYLLVAGTADSQSAWEALLGRKPRTLEWRSLDQIASMQRLLGFDFSETLHLRRTCAQSFHIRRRADGISFDLGTLHHSLGAGFRNRLVEQCVLKMLLNAHSTLVMGRLGRYQGNIMTWVRPSCNKLIDRAIRYVDLFLREQGISLPYAELARELFTARETIAADQSIVPATMVRIVRNRPH